MAGSLGLSAATISTIATVGKVVSTGVGFLGKLQQGNAAAQAGNNQAALFARQAQREAEIGALNARRVREKGKSLAGTQRALISGDASTGSNLLAQTGLSEETEFNARLAEANADFRADESRAQAVLARQKGRFAQTSSAFRGGSNLLSEGVSAFG
jgi:hypothetical protein